MKRETNPNPNPNQDAIDIDTFHPEDATGIVELFREVYGDHYPIRLFYDPESIIAANEAGNYYSIVARTASGNVVGVCHVFRSAPSASVYECGVGLVLKEYRNGGVNFRMLEYIYETFIPLKDHIEVIFGEPVCNHVHNQKTVIHFKHVEMGMEIALMPAAAYAKEKSAAGRVAALDSFRCYKPKPHRIYIPAPYQESLRWLYSRLDDSRDIVVSEDSAPAEHTSRITLERFDFAHLARMAIHEIGQNFSQAFNTVEAQAIDGKAVVLQAWLDMGIPWVGSAVEWLRGNGYFFGGALPRWFDTDGFMMQKLLCPPDFDEIVLHSEDARKILEIVRMDQHRVDSPPQLG